MPPSIPAPAIDTARRPPQDQKAAANAAGMQSAPTHPKPSSALAAMLEGSASTAIQEEDDAATVHQNLS